jgi:DNA-binding NarL/FixJ family response regulator
MLNINSTNFIVVESQPLLRDAITKLIEKQTFAGNVYSIASIDGIEEIIDSKSVHCIIIDPAIDASRSLTKLSEIVSIRPNLYILAYSYSVSSFKSVMWNEINVMGMVSKLDPIETFESALMAATNGYAFRKQSKGQQTNNATLSAREATVLALLTDGLRNKEVARRLDISDKTVSTYKRRVLDKFEVDNIMELLSIPEVNQAMLSYR